VLAAVGASQLGAGVYEGTCDALGDEAYDLPTLEEGYGATTIPAPAGTLLDGNHVIAITKTPESDEVVACGALPAD
jgi:hypothetical protein